MPHMSKRNVAGRIFPCRIHTKVGASILVSSLVIIIDIRTFGFVTFVKYDLISHTYYVSSNTQIM